MKILRGTRNDVVVEVTETTITATAPATAAGFSDLILSLCQVHEAWKVPNMPPIDGPGE